MVIYGPNEKFKEEIFSSLRDESTGTFYLPTIGVYSLFILQKWRDFLYGIG